MIWYTSSKFFNLLPGTVINVYIKHFREMLEKLHDYLRRQIFISVYLRDEEKPLLVAVDDIGIDFISVKPWTLHGNYVERRIFYLHEIGKVLPLKARYNDPFFVKLRNIKSTIRKIRTDMDRL